MQQTTVTLNGRILDSLYHKLYILNDHWRKLTNLLPIMCQSSKVSVSKYVRAPRVVIKKGAIVDSET